MLKYKSFLDYTNLFSPNDDYEKNHKKILKYFQQLKRWKKYYIICGRSRKFEKPK